MSHVVTPTSTRAFYINLVGCWLLLPQLSKEKTTYIVKQLLTIEVLDIILAEKRNASINSGVVFLKKIVDFIWLFNFFNSLFHFLLNAIGLVS